MKKIVFLDAATLGAVENIDVFSQFGEYVKYDFTASEERVERVKGADIVISNKVMIDKSVIDSCPTLKLICVAATGMNNVDLAYAAERGIAVKNVAGYSTDSVAQITFSLVLELLSHTAQFDNYVKTEYAGSRSFTCMKYEYSEIAGKRYGIIGLGTIGRRVAAIASAFGAEVVYYSTSGANNNSEYRRVELDELLTSCDIVSVHSPLNDKTNNLIDYNKLSLMKPTSIIVNVGRGGIVNEADLARALDANLIAGAGVDVFCKEPVLADNPLLKVRNSDKLVMTPHIAWASREARYRLVNMIVDNIKSFLVG